MALRLYNSRTRSLDDFEPLRPGIATIYVCGMTPSFHPHVGHARTFLTFDVLRRHLRNSGLAVKYVQNVTDIDDRIIDRSTADGIPWDQVVTRYLDEYEECASRLGLLAPDVEPRATASMGAIVEMIRGLVESGAAYETADGVYFSVKSFPRYGELSNRNVDELRAGERVALREDKRDPLDFALWKKAKPGEPTWPSPWGDGRPGWHIECSAMSRRYLGDRIDIHGGATDLIFPHHENEVAQSESYTHVHPMARFWVHAGLLMVDGRKMSKSLGNFTPLSQMLDAYPPAAIRFLFLQTGYRKPINFTDESIESAIRGLRGLYADLDELRSKITSPGADGPPADAAAFDAFLDDDLNTAGAVAWLRTRLKDLRPSGAAADIGGALALATRCLATLGLPGTSADAGLAPSRRVELDETARALLEEALGGTGSVAEDSTLVERAVAALDEARASKNYARSDALRDVLSRAGIAVRNTASGTEWSVDGSR